MADTISKPCVVAAEIFDDNQKNSNVVIINVKFCKLNSKLSYNNAFSPHNYYLGIVVKLA